MKNTKRFLSLLLALLTVFSAVTVIPGLFAFADEEADGGNVAKGKPVYVNSGKNNTFRVTDGDADTFWSTVSVPAYAEVDLEDNYAVNRVIVRQPLREGSVRSYKTAFNVYGSLDGVNFDRIGLMEEPLKADENGFVFEIEGAPEYRVIRVMSTMSTKGSYATTYISEIEVFGEKTASAPTPTRTSIDFPSYEEWLLEKCGVDLSAVKDEKGVYSVKDTYTEKDTYEALEGLVCRILGADYVSWFEFRIGKPGKNGYDFYEISDKDGKILIEGNEGVSIAAGLNHYLKYFCSVNVSQETKQVRMPDKVVPVGEKIRKETHLPVRYTYNYCTLSYTMSFYGFDNWQRELDYLMLSGINVVLDTTATEALWVLYLQNYGYTVQEAIEYVCGYTWKAWWLMGNLESYGGPVSDNWIVDTVEMARVNQRYLAVMGADPCLQTFTGTLPTNFAVKAAKVLSDQGYDNVAKYITPTGGWAGFTRPYALNTTYDGFDAMAKKFYETQDYIYGRIGDYYAGDFLHEIEGSFKLDPKFDKANMSRTVLDKLLEENKNGVWIIQSWWENPLPEVVKGWGDDREDHILLLDLAAVQGPRWKNLSNYGGLEFGSSSWCYCILENYGGRDGAHLNLSTMTRNMALAFKDAKHMKGIGLTSEATERNPVVFDLFWEQAWSKSAISVNSWIEKYAERRYGGTGNTVDAWKLLLRTVYGTGTADGTTVNYAINNYPKFDYKGGYFVSGYSAANYEKALKLLLEDFDLYCEEETYIYDLVELFQNKLSDITTNLLGNMFKAAQNADYETFHPLKTKYLHAMKLLDELTSFEKDQMLGNWLGRVDDWANDPRTGVYSDFDMDLMKLDALILITNWSMIDLGNYAYRQYSGLISDYYYAMWNHFLTKAEDRISAGTAITNGSDTLGVSNTITYYNLARQIALDVISGKKEYPSEPVPVSGDSCRRGMKELLDEIVRDYFSTSEVTPTAASLKEGSLLKTDGEVLTGDAPGRAAADLAGEFDVTNGARVVFLDENGEVLPDGAEVPEGAKAVIMEEDGSLYDALGFTVGKINAFSTDADKEAFRKAISDVESEIGKLNLRGFETRVKQNVETLLAAKDATCVSALKAAADRAPAVLEEARAEDARLLALQKEKRAELNERLAALKELAGSLDVARTPAQLSAECESALTGAEALGAYANDVEIKTALRAVRKALEGAVAEKARQDAEDAEKASTETPAETSEPSLPNTTPDGQRPAKAFPLWSILIVCAAVACVAAIVVVIALKSRKKKA